MSETKRKAPQMRKLEDCICTIDCINSDPPMNYDDETLLHPDVKSAVWVFNCWDPRCDDCWDVRFTDCFGTEHLEESDDEPDGESDDKVLQMRRDKISMKCNSCSQYTTFVSVHSTNRCCLSSSCEEAERQWLKEIYQMRNWDYTI